MYFLVIFLLLLLCPAISVAVDAARHQLPFWNAALIGKWWVFWAVGVRLFLAGVRQTMQPRFTAENIFETHDVKALPIVREVGFGNLSMGIVAIFSLFCLAWIIPEALVGGLYYGLAGGMHLMRRNKNAIEMAAMISDIFVAGVLLSFAFLSLRQ